MKNNIRIRIIAQNNTKMRSRSLHTIIFTKHTLNKNNNNHKGNKNIDNNTNNNSDNNNSNSNNNDANKKYQLQRIGRDILPSHNNSANNKWQCWRVGRVGKVERIRIRTRSP